MTEKVNKTTTARIEEKLDVVAENIINLENTATHLEMIKNGFRDEIKKAQDLQVKLNFDSLKKYQSEYLLEVAAINEEHLNDIRKKNKYYKFAMYCSIIQLVVIILLSFSTSHYYYKGEHDRQFLNSYYKNFIQDNKLEKTYMKWREAK